MKTKQPKSADKGAFFTLLTRASRPLAQPSAGKSEPQSAKHGDYSGKKIRPRKPASTSGKLGGKSR